MTLPKMVCFLSRCLVGRYVMKLDYPCQYIKIGSWGRNGWRREGEKKQRDGKRTIDSNWYSCLYSPSTSPLYYRALRGRQIHPRSCGSRCWFRLYRFQWGHRLGSKRYQNRFSILTPFHITSFGSFVQQRQCVAVSNGQEAGASKHESKRSIDQVRWKEKKSAIGTNIP